MQITGFSDSDWGGSSDRKSTSGYVFKSSSSSSLISWKSKKQNIVALSSCEAEYIALTYAVQEGIFLEQLLCDMDGYDEPVGIFVDNRGAIDLAKNLVHHQRSKHIDIRYHFIRAIIQDNKAVLSFVPSEENMADMFTKPVTRQSLLKFKCNRGVEETVEHLVLECSKYEQERESLMDVVHEQCGENKWNARCVEEDSGMRYLVGLDEECNMTVLDAMKDFLVYAWNKRQGC
ncbi:hypothetical protein FHG87_015148 [Trinorchestia longiramus]|nr:hypothetical protein FHG87_015148 [Trinorchestia longiramus]